MPPKKQKTRKIAKMAEKSESEQKLELEQLFQQLNTLRIFLGSQKKDVSDNQLRNMSRLIASMMSTSNQPKPKEEHFCSVCHQEFPTKMTWWWHDLRHVGHHKFKCTICNKVVDSPTACWMHELNAHGYAAKPFLYDPRKDLKQLSEPQPEVGTSIEKKDKPSLSQETDTSSQSDVQRMSLDFQKNLPWFYGPSSEPQPGTSKELLATTKSDELQASGESSTGSGQAKVSMGGSPIDRMEITDLLSIQTIRKQLQCSICGKKAMELGVIADCLLDHGIYRCALCFNTYSNKKDLEMHMIQCHGSGFVVRKLRCPLCPRVFSNYVLTCGHLYCEHWKQLLKQIEEEDKKEEEMKNGKEVTNEVGDEEVDHEQDEEDTKQVTGGGNSEREGVTSKQTD